MKYSYREGTWFAVPLQTSGFAVGRIARRKGKGSVLLCYFFGPRRISVPALVEIEYLKPKDAIRIIHVGDLSLLRGEWPIIGDSKEWVREAWPIPKFIRRDPLSRTAWRVTYSDRNPNEVIQEDPISYDSNELRENSLYGAGAAEIELTKALAE